MAVQKRLKRRVFGGFAGALALLTVLTGCMQVIPAEDLPAYTVLQKDSRDEDGKRDFSYIDSTGAVQETECSKKNGAFSRTVCESADGVLSFEYSMRKSRVRLREITVDGSERKMSRISTDMEGTRRAWAPSDSIPEVQE